MMKNASVANIITRRASAVMKVAVLSLIAALALVLTGCAGDSSSSEAAPPQNTASDIAVNVFLTEYVAQSEDADAEVQFADEQINVIAPEGSNALDVLKATGREVKTSGKGTAERVTSISGLSNGDVGSDSKWVYELNGTPQDGPAAECILNNGDTLTWKFVDEA